VHILVDTNAALIKLYIYISQSRTKYNLLLRLRLRLVLLLLLISRPSQRIQFLPRTLFSSLLHPRIPLRTTTHQPGQPLHFGSRVLTP
jgi:hypothetical protein